MLLLLSCFWPDLRPDYLDNFDDSLMQEPSLASLPADALSENEIGNHISDKRPETGVL